ncbi:MAG: bifunctional hydroxymethylpyrimidine kinase/phosphomethylpyrimidine kinase [Firmicutes bacterium]|nr:bifunctional hydroxymethylpyrimidine kinase/phosphomethylpyrimidine kinase [Bacillota bacterium]
MKTALTIAGSDCSGGAGIQADIKTFCAFGVYGMSVITSVVAENTCGVIKSENITAEMIHLQLKAVFEDIFPDAIKIGMVSDAKIIECIADDLKKYNAKNVVSDPVMAAKDGYKLLNDNALDIYINKLIPLTLLLTPNIPEAEILSGFSIKTKDDMKKAAEKIISLGCENVLIKGGHMNGDSTDILFDGNKFYEFEGKRIHTKNTHGTGCTLSSAIASSLACGENTEISVKKAKSFLTSAIENSLELGKGNGPLNHLIG